MTKLKVKFPGLELIKNISGSKELNCILGISVGQSYHEGEKLDAIIDGINEHFSKCYIEVGDLLQRYNYLMLGFSEKKAYQEAIITGETWRKNNLGIIQRLKIPYVIHSWDKWILAKDSNIQVVDQMSDCTPLKLNLKFKEALEYVQNLYHKNAEYEETLDLAVSQIFVAKKNSSVCTIRKKEAEALIRNYLEEELAVVLLWENKIKDSVFVYPNSSGKAPQIAFECYKKLIASIPTGFRLYIGDIQFFTINKQTSKKNSKKLPELPVSNRLEDNSLTENSPITYNFNFFQSNAAMPVTSKSSTEKDLSCPMKKEVFSAIFESSAKELLKTTTVLEKEKLESFTAHVFHNILTLSNSAVSKNKPRTELKRISI